MYYLIDTRGCA